MNEHERDQRDTQWLLNTSREMAERDRISYLEAAEARGEARGSLKGQIGLLQHYLGLAKTTEAEFAVLNVESLEKLLEQLQTEFSQRS